MKQLDFICTDNQQQPTAISVYHAVTFKIAELHKVLFQSLLTCIYSKQTLLSCIGFACMSVLAELVLCHVQLTLGKIMYDAPILKVLSMLSLLSKPAIVLFVCRCG